MTQPKGFTTPRSLIFEDHFTGAMRPEWQANLWYPGIINNEQQAYSVDALEQRADRLVIHVESLPTPLPFGEHKVMPYRSGLIHTRGRFTVIGPGVAEARIKIPKGRGLWSAFWLLSPDKSLTAPKPEIDIFEILNNGESLDERMVNCNYHNGANPKRPLHWKTPLDLSAGYHIYACAWDAEGISYYLDGVCIGRTSGRTYLGPYHPIINCAVGGSWSGPADPVVKEQMHIDYVRIWA